MTNSIIIKNSTLFQNILIKKIEIIYQKEKASRLILKGIINVDDFYKISESSLMGLIANLYPIKTFILECPVQITLQLKTQYISVIDTPITPESILEKLEELSQIQIDRPNLCKSIPELILLDTESWLCLAVSQKQSTGEVGFHTIWNYLDPDVFLHEDLTDKTINETVQQSLKSWVIDNLEAFSEETTLDVLNEFSSNLEKLLTHEIHSITARAISDVTLELTKTFQAEQNKTMNTSSIQSPSLLMATISFFTADDWSFTKIEGETALSLGFEGDNGTWNCYAKVREEQQQFIFYSICPVTISEDKRQAAAEFITRANYGIFIGNFELDFSDGEIRYKTSIDVEGDTLSSMFIKHLVYTNVTMMDEYLPGIIAVAEGKLSPQEAIDQIEN